jgi:hypothetical protein
VVSPPALLLPAAAFSGLALHVDAAGWAAVAVHRRGQHGAAVLVLLRRRAADAHEHGVALLTLEPVAVAALAYLVLGESLMGLQLLGGALIVGAVALLSLQGPAGGSPAGVSQP